MKRSLPLTLALSALALAPLAAHAARAPYEEGQEIEITGAVTDGDGRPLSGRTVVLEVYRRGFSLRSLSPSEMGRSKKGLQQRTAITDEIGRYTITWPWHDYYNRFELSVGDFGDDGYYVEERADLSRRVMRGSPVIVSFVIGESTGGAVAPAPAGAVTTPAQPVRETRPASGGSGDEDRILGRYGEPDRIDRLELPYGVEVTWWYFDRGRAYRFLDGELSDELSFDPVAGR